MTIGSDRVVVLLVSEETIWLRHTENGFSAPSELANETYESPLDSAAERLAARILDVDVEGAADPIAYLRSADGESTVGVFLVSTAGQRPQPTDGTLKAITEGELAQVLDDPEAVADPFTLIALQHRLLQIMRAGENSTQATPLDSKPKPAAEGFGHRSAVLLERGDRYGYTGTFDIEWFQANGDQGAGPTNMLLGEALDWARSIAARVVVRPGAMTPYTAGDVAAIDPETGGPMATLPAGFEVHPRPLSDG